MRTEPHYICLFFNSVRTQLLAIALLKKGLIVTMHDRKTHKLEMHYMLSNNWSFNLRRNSVKKNRPRYIVLFIKNVWVRKT